MSGQAVFDFVHTLGARVAAAVALTVTLTAPLAFAQDGVSVSLNRIHREYLALRSRPDVGRLVLLDQQLRRLLPYWSGVGSPIGSSAFEPEYEQLGV